MKFSLILSSALFAAACGPSRTASTTPEKRTPEREEVAEPPVGALARAKELLAGDWAVAGEQVPVVFLHPHGGKSAFYAVAAAGVPVIWVFDDTPAELTPEERHLQVYRYHGEQVRHCEEQVDGGEGIIFSCEDGAGGLRFLANGDALDVEEWTASSGPDTTHLVEADGAPAPALEDADRAFATAVDGTNVDAWVAAFSGDAIQWQRDTMIKGHDAIKTAMTETLGQLDIRWQPTVSRMLVADGLGVTSGTAQYTPADGSEGFTGTYVTLWRRDPTGWKVLADTGAGDR